MENVTAPVKSFFDVYENAIGAVSVEKFSDLYADTFLFGGPSGAQSIKKEEFLKVLPKRKTFFASIGLKSTKLQALTETKLDEAYVLIKARWKFRYEKDSRKPIEDEGAATYILFSHEKSLRIVFQIDHQDLTKRAKELGLM